jgi:hypothetical protein
LNPNDSSIPARPFMRYNMTNRWLLKEDRIV